MRRVTSPNPEVLVPLTKTTTRALAASIAIVAAGATVAGAAVFHLPVLGFGPAPASAAATPVRAEHTRKVTPIKVVRTRYVDDIVHRPAPVIASPPVYAVAARYPAPSAAPAAPVARVRIAAPSRTTASVAPTPPAGPTYHEGSEPDQEGSDHAPPGGHGSTSTTTTAHGSDQ